MICVVEYVNHCSIMWMQIQQFCSYCTEGADMPIFVAQLNKWFACRCIIPRFLSSNCSSLSLYLLHVLVLSRMEPVIQNLLTHFWRFVLFGTGTSGNFSESLVTLSVGTVFVVSFKNTWWLNGTTDDVYRPDSFSAVMSVGASCWGGWGEYAKHPNRHD